MQIIFPIEMQMNCPVLCSYLLLCVYQLCICQFTFAFLIA